MEDGSCIRVTENEVVSFALYTGMEISDELYDRLTESAGRSAVRGKALDLISSRPMSRKELIEKLTARRPRGKDGRERPPFATAEQAGEVADWLEELGYLNDAEYARTVARHYSAKGYGSGSYGMNFSTGGSPGSIGRKPFRRLRIPNPG